MRRRAFALLVASVLPGCLSYDAGPETGGFRPGGFSKAYSAMSVPSVVGAGGSPVPMAAPYAASRPGSPMAAQNMMAQSVPLHMVHFNPTTNGGLNGPTGAMLPAAMAPGGGVMMPPGIGLPPGMGAPPGMGGMPGMGMPGMGMPGMPMPGMPGMNGIQPTGGVMPAGPNMPHGGVMQAGGIGANMNAVRFNAQRTQVRFDRPAGMKVSWYSQGPDGQPAFSNVPIETPGRYNFTQGAIYRLKISSIDGRPGLEVYPTMEVVPANPKSEAFLAHAAVPVSFTNDDFKQIAEGSFLIKVIYLPDRQFQEAGGAAIDEITSTRLDPGVDPVEEAARRGCILLIMRMGNVDQEAPNTPSLSSPTNQGPSHPPMMPMFGAPPHTQVPYHQNFGPNHTPGVAGPIGALPPGPLPPGIHPHAQGPVAPPMPGATVPGIPTSRESAPGIPGMFPNSPLSPRKGSATISDDARSPKSPISTTPFTPPLPSAAPVPTPPNNNGLPLLPPIGAWLDTDSKTAPTIPVSAPLATPELPAVPAVPVTPPAAAPVAPPPVVTPSPLPPAVTPAPLPPMVTPAPLPPSVTPAPLPPVTSEPMTPPAPLAAPMLPPVTAVPAMPPVTTVPLAPPPSLPMTPTSQAPVAPIPSAPLAPPMPQVTSIPATPPVAPVVIPASASQDMPQIIPAAAPMPPANAFGIRTIGAATPPLLPAVAPMPPANGAGVRTIMSPENPSVPLTASPVNPGMPMPPGNLPQLPVVPLQ